MKKSLFVIASIGILSASAFAANPHYQIVQRFSLGAATKWDFTAIDEARHRLFVTRGDHVDVVELPSGKIAGTIPDTHGVHGVAFAQELRLGFTSNGKGNSVTVFNLDTLKPVDEIKITGSNPDALLYEPTVQKLFVFNGKSANFDVIDAKTLKVIDTVEVTGKPEFAVADGRGKIYLNIEDNAGINVIDVASNKVIAKWQLEKCEEPSGLAIDAKNSRLFSSCANGLMAVTDANSGKRVTQFPIGEHPDAVIYDADTHTVLTSGGGGTGTLTVAHQDNADHYTVLAQVVTEKGAKTMAMTAKEKTVYLPVVVGDKFVVLVAARKK
jgi:YVTN family beta-propeller protein